MFLGPVEVTLFHKSSDDMGQRHNVCPIIRLQPDNRAAPCSGDNRRLPLSSAFLFLCLCERIRCLLTTSRAQKHRGTVKVMTPGTMLSSSVFKLNVAEISGQLKLRVVTC